MLDVSAKGLIRPRQRKLVLLMRKNIYWGFRRTGCWV